MPKPPIRQVTACENCPFAATTAAVPCCQLATHSLPITAHLGNGSYPPKCPLLPGPVTIRLALRGARGPGRPAPEVRPGFAAEVKHFLNWLRTQRGGLWIPVTELAEKNSYGPEVKLSHFRAALAGRRPFYEAELDKATAFAKARQDYPGYSPADPAQ